MAGSEPGVLDGGSQRLVGGGGGGGGGGGEGEGGREGSGRSVW